MSDKKKKQIKISLISCLAVLMVALITFTTLGIIFSNRKKAPGETVVNPLEWSVDEWDGESEDDLHWFSGDEYANRGEKSYTIDSVASFIYFVNITNDATLAREYDYFKDYTVYLNTNLNLNGHAMKSIGIKVDTGDSVISTFQGTFDASYYTIHNATIDGAGLFGYVENATIKNVGLYNATIDSTDDYVGGIVGYAINTNIEDTYVRLGSVTGAGTVGGLVGKMLSTNGTYHITNSFADTSITGATRGGLVGNVDCNTMDANNINLDYCYYTGEYTATGNTVTNLSTSNVFRATDIGQFYAWDYEPSYSLAYTWCNYSFAPNSTELSFSYPILAKFNKVFMTGSCYENTVVSLDDTGAVSSEASNVTTIADAFDLADDNETVKVEMIVEQATMDAPAIVKANAEVWLDTEKNIDITRSNTMSDVLITAGENASLVIGSDDNTNTITIDGNSDYVEANNLQSSAMIVINATAGSNIGSNVELQNNINNTDGNGGIIAIVDGEEYRNVETVRNNLNLLTSSSSVRPRRTAITTSSTHQVSSNISGGSASYGGGLYVYITSTSGTTVIGVIADITSCTAGSYGGGVYLYGARTSQYRNFLFGSGVTSSSVDSSVILRGNRANNGGGIYASSSGNSYGWTIRIYGSIDNNRASSYGGAIYCQRSQDLQIQNTGKIFYNTASRNGGGIYFSGSYPDITGGSTSRIYSNTASGEGDNTYGISTRTVTLNGRGSSSSSVKYTIQYLDSCPEYKPTGYFDWNSRTLYGWSSSSNSTSRAISGSSTNIINTSTTDSTNTYFMLVRDKTQTTTTESYASSSYTVSFNANTTGYSGSTSSLTGTIYRYRYKYTRNIYGWSGYTLGSTTSYSSAYESSRGSVTLPTLTKNGYSFDGWRLNSTSGTLYSAGSSFKLSSGTSCTMYGDWSVNTYKITFNENGGSSVSDINYDITDTITLPSTSRNGYTFVGWKPSSSVGNWSTSTTYVSTLSGHYYGNVTLVAQWNRNTYTITFNENGGSSVNNISYNITSTTTLPSTSRNGYTFNGWRPTRSAGGWSSSSNYAAGYSVRGKYASITMNAQWTLRTYTITFNENGGSSVNDITYDITDTIAMPSTSRNGYTFAGWKPSSSSGNWSSNTSYGTGNYFNMYGTVTMVAQWRLNTYTITFDENGGNSVNNISYNITSTITLPTPTRSGYSFQGWKPSSSVGNWSSGTTYAAGSRSGMYGNVTLVAQWRDSQAPTISRTTWVQNGDNEYYAYAYVTDNVGVSRVQFPTWTDKNGQDDIQSNWESNSSASGTAGSWTVNGNSYNYRFLVRVSDHNNEYGAYRTHVYAYDAQGNRASTDNTPTDYIYLSWTVTFNGNGGSVPSSITYNYISSSTLPTPSRTGYTFAGWKPSYTSGSWSSSSNYAAGTSLAGKHGTVTLVAQWTINEYVASFETNDGNNVNLLTINRVDNGQSINGITISWDEATGIITINGTVSGAVEFMRIPVTFATGDSYTVRIEKISGSVTGSGGNPFITYDFYDSTGSNRFTYSDVPCVSVGTSTKTISSSNAGSGYIAMRVYNTFNPVYSNAQYRIKIEKSSTSTAFTPMAKTITYNSTYGTLPTPTRTGYTFAGWYRESSLTNQVTASTTMTTTSNHTLYAKWTINTYKITFDENGGSTVSDIDYNITSTTTLPSTSRDGYTFAGWKPSASSGNWSSSVTYAAGTSLTGQYGSVTLVAQWTINTYTISFDEAGGNEISDINYTITSTTTLPSTTRNGYTFAGWKPTTSAGGWNSGTTYTAGTSVNGKYASITMTAQWTINTYTITFDEDGGTPVNDMEYNINSTSTLPITSRNGYAFLGWKPTTSAGGWNSNDVYGEGSEVTGKYADITLVAQWSDPIDYQITFDEAGGSEVSDISYNITSTTTLPSTTRNGYTFAGWKPETNEGNWDTGRNYSANTSVSGQYGNVTLVAQWTVISYTITFNENGGSAVDDITHNIDSTATLPSTTRNGYTFAGWKPSSTAGGWDASVNYPAGTSVNGKYASITMVAQWNATPYTITFDEAGGNAVNDINYTIESTATLPSTAKAGYTFSGWKPETSVGSWSNSQTYSAGTTLTGKYGSVTMVAQWTVQTYDIHYYDQGGETFSGSFSGAYPTTHTYGAATTLVSPTKANYNFDGWFVNSACTGSPITTIGATSYTSDINLYAKWTINAHTVTINVNNSAYGKVSSTSVEAPHGSTITTSGATLTIRSGSETIATITATANAGYMFESWTNASGTVTADKTITANFVKTVEINIEVVGLNSDETYGVYYDDTTYTNDFNMVSGGTLRILASTGAGNGENSYRIVSVYRNNTREVGPYSGEITTTGITGSTWENVTDDVTIRFEFKYGYKIETEVTESNTDGVTVDAGDEVTNEGIISSDAAVTIEIDLDTLLGGADNKEYLGIVYKEQGSDSTSSIGTEGGGVLSGSQSGNKYTYTVEEGAILDSITVIVKEIVPITLTWHTGDPSTIQLVSEEGFIRVLTNGSSSYNLYASKWEITVSSGSVDLNDLKAIFSNNANNVTQEGGKFYLTVA